MRYSVVICTYNGERFIAEQINSILAQTRRVDEILLFDDGSTDSTLSIAGQLLSKGGIPYRITKNEQNKGVARNFIDGAQQASGDYIFFSDQDDVWKKTKVEIFHRHIVRTGKMLYFSDGIVVDEDLVQTGTLWRSVGFDHRREDISVTMFIKDIVTGAASAVSREVAAMAADIPPNVLHDRWLSLIAAANDSIEFIRSYTFYYRQHSNNVVGAAAPGVVEQVRDRGVFNREKTEKRCRDMALVYEELKKYSSKENYPRVAECARFWRSCEQLTRIGRAAGVKCVIRELFNGNYFRYRSGIVPAVRDLGFVLLGSAPSKERKMHESNTR
ncbi:MAG: glycosyltransferase family 2 protein [Ruminococcus sp.]|nr:glycosyltransferase family 2 protein [Ruminococcus sp.]